MRHWLAGCNATWTSLVRSEGLQQRYTQATRPIALCRVYFDKRLRPALERLLDAAVAAEVVRPGIEADDLLRAVATLCHGAHGEESAYARKMVELLVDGLRYGAGTRIEKPGKRRR